MPGPPSVEIRRVLITGANGFVATAVSQALRARGVEVVGVDLVANPEHGVVAADITRAHEWGDQLRGCDVVIHTAAVVSNAVGAKEQWRVNVDGTRRVVDAAAAAGVKRFVHVSSVRAFSDTDFPNEVGEEHPVRPDGNAYVDTKIASEHVLLAAHAAGQIEAVIVRPSDIYGPRSEPWVLKPLDLIARGQLILPAMGRGVFSPVYIDDLVDGLVLAATHPAASGQIFTLGGPSPVWTRDYFGHLYEMAGRRGPICVPTPVAVALAACVDRVNRLRGRPNEVNASTVRYLTRTGTYSSDKARRILGYRPQIGLAEGMANIRADREQRGQ